MALTVCPQSSVMVGAAGAATCGAAGAAPGGGTTGAGSSTVSPGPQLSWGMTGSLASSLAASALAASSFSCSSGSLSKVVKDV